MKRIGIIINPIAGMGGKVGLKGTDTPKILKEAIKRGATPVADKRVKRLLKRLLNFPECENLLFLVPKGKMGENIFKSINDSNSKLKWNIVEDIAIPENTSSKETFELGKFFKKEQVDLLMFVGGDGTARDILEAVGSDFPILGIPSGVKIHSGVFAQEIEKSVEILRQFVRDEVEFVHSEVIDLDEEEFRKDNIIIKLFGLGLVPKAPSLMQLSKTSSSFINSEKENLEAIIQTFKGIIEPEILYLLGSGSTIKALAKAFSNIVYEHKTQLGIDAVQNFSIIKKDINELDILKLLENRKPNSSKIILTPIGGQGFIFGRGNQQLSPLVIRKVGIKNVMIVATLSKVENLPNRVLHVDTGDIALDNMFKGYIKVLVDYEKYQMVKIE